MTATQQSSVGGAPPQNGPGVVLARRLLSARRPLDAAARAEIDATLRAGSSDPKVHAAALLIAATHGGSLGLDRSRPRCWALGLEELIASGHLEAAAAVAERLRQQLPPMTYVSSMAAVLPQLPTPSETDRAHLRDDRRKDVQLVPVPGAETLVLAFCGLSRRMGLSLNLMDRWLGQLGSHVLYLRDRFGVGFTRGVADLGATMVATEAALVALAHDLGAKRLVCVGTSAGATGAMRFGCALGAVRVLALSPITAGTDYVVAPLYCDGAGVRTRVLFGERHRGDRENCLRLVGLPDVTVEAIPRWDSHSVALGLVKARRMKEVVAWLNAASDDIVDDWIVTSTYEGSEDRE